MPPRTLAAVSLVYVLALAVPVLVTGLADPAAHAIQLGTAVATVLAWEAGFAVLRGRAASLHGLVTALVVCVLIPVDLALWQLVVTLSLGFVLGELVFGGRGFGFLNAATVTLSLLIFSFPQVELVAPGQSLVLATLPGAVLLMALGLISWRVMLAMAGATIAALALAGHPVEPLAIITALAFGLVFLIADPMVAASTNAGRWIYGALSGGLVVVLSGGATLSSEAVVFASLMASIFAPLIDHLVVLAHARRRRMRHA